MLRRLNVKTGTDYNLLSPLNSLSKDRNISSGEDGGVCELGLVGGGVGGGGGGETKEKKNL